ncbi:MAG TPA: PEGA domain-containing protein [Pirellulales bacterium]|jgi:hypothetical protein
MSIFDRRHRYVRWFVPLAVCAGMLISLTGCVERRMTIRSNPPGATVYVDDYEIGTTPVSHDFTYYGTRKVRLVKDGYETLTVYQPMPTPWYDLPGVDFFTENLWPHKIRDDRAFEYQMIPSVNVPTEQLLGRAEQLRNASRVQPAAGVQPLLPPPAGTVAPPPATIIGQPPVGGAAPATIPPGATFQSGPPAGAVPPAGSLPYGPPGSMAPTNGALPNYTPPGGYAPGGYLPNGSYPTGPTGTLPSPSFAPGNTPSGAPNFGTPAMPQPTPGTFPGAAPPMQPAPGVQPPPTFNQPAVPPDWRPIGQAPNQDDLQRR